MAVKCGIVGLPNVGKSTLFNALTKAGIAAENFPFCTIEPNSGIVSIPDARLDKLAEIVQPQKVIPTTMEFTDIAGLVAGASKGEGLGNQFLANIRECDAISHVVRCFEDEQRHPRFRQDRPSRGYRNHQYRTRPGRPGELSRNTWTRSSALPRGGDKDAQRHEAVLEKAHDPPERGEACALPQSEQRRDWPHLYSLHLTHHQAHDVYRQRR